MTLITLPASLDKSRRTIAEEVSYARSLSTIERVSVLANVCRADLRLLKLNKHKDRLLLMKDPLPDSTIVALERLKKDG